MRDPDIEGPSGRAWLYRVPEAMAGRHTSLAAWLVNRPGAHPFWQWWFVAVVHLRDTPGVGKAYKRYPEAEYEFMIYSIDPTSCPNPEPDDPDGYPALSPLDVVEQFHGVRDPDVERICEGAVRAIVNGNISPDQDYRHAWSLLLAGTVQHFKEGRHPTH